MFVQPSSATRRSFCLCPRLTQVSALHTLCAVGLTLLLLTCQVYAAQLTLTWDDPNNNPADVGGYRLYYWQATWQTPASLDVGKQTSYTLTGLEADQTYLFAVTAHDASGGRESDASNVISNVQPLGLVAAYAFDEGSGATVADASDNNNTGILGSGVTWTSQGTFGSALVFNGSSYITVNDAPSLDLTTGMTLEAWVYPTVTPTHWSTVLMKEQPGQFVYVLCAGSPSNRPNLYSNRPNLYFNDSTFSSGGGGVTGPAALPLNTWSHLAGTYDGTTLSLYINGALVASQALAGPIAPSLGALRIGGNDVWGEYFQGRIDEVRIYNRALSAPEIQADMQTPINVLNSLPEVLP
jgi:hypothetical protein